MKKQAHLDFFLVSEESFEFVYDNCVVSGYRTDHSGTILKLKFDNNERGKGYWKFNNSLLKDNEYIQIVKKAIEEVKNTYKVIDVLQDRELNINNNYNNIINNNNNNNNNNIINNNNNDNNNDNNNNNNINNNNNDGKCTRASYNTAKRIARRVVHHARHEADKVVYEGIDH